MWKSFNNIISGINESVRGKTSHWILIYLRITTISTLHQTKLSINFLIRLQHHQWNFPLGIWHIVVASLLVAVAGSNQIKPTRSRLSVHDIKGNRIG